jgi:hypothetical protein
MTYIALCAQRISYISYLCEPRGKSTFNKVNNMLSNYVLFKLSQIYCFRLAIYL